LRQTPEIKRALDESVPEYDPRGGEPRRSYYTRRAARAVLALVLAVATAGLIVYILHHYKSLAQSAPPLKRAVPVYIIPAQK
jgi:hypothetical protein